MEEEATIWNTQSIFVQQHPVTKSRATSVSGRILAAFTVNIVAAKTKHRPLR